MRRLLILVVASASVAAAVGVGCGVVAVPDPRAVGVPVPAGAPLPLLVEPDPEIDAGEPPVALAPPGGAILQPGVVRLPKPKIDLDGQRRVGIQIGHLEADDVPAEYGPRIVTQTGTSWAGITEVEVTAVIAERLAALLEAQGLAVDIIPTTVPEGYLADAFVSLHADGDGVGEKSGYKLARGSRRGPYEDPLLERIKSAYGQATGLPYDAEGISSAMRGYYAFNWSRYRGTASPFTPAVIIELGFLSHDSDRDLLVDRPNVVAGAIAKGIFAFLDDTPRAKMFGEDLLITVPQRRGRPTASP